MVGVVMTTRLGVDYSSSRPGAPALRAAGYTFACRYLAAGSSRNAAKALTRSEADALRAGGVDLVSNWETTADRALDGRAAGVYDAQQAAKLHTACGGPPGRPIYFSVDWDASEAQQPAINAYFQGVASVIGLARTGAYGGYWPLSRLFDAGLIRWGWQTYAWSGGHWDPRAQLRQVKNGIKVGGADCDRDEAHADDFGQWGYTPLPPKPAQKPSPEEDMAIIAQDAVGKKYLCVGFQSYPIDPAREKDIRYLASQGMLTLSTMANQAHPIPQEWTKDGSTRLGWDEAAFGPLATPAGSVDLDALAQKVTAGLIASNTNGLTDADHAAIEADVKAALRAGTGS